MKILNFGSLNIDSVYRVDRLANSGETISSIDMQTLPGGKGLNQSVSIRRAGFENIYHAGNIGFDGEFLLFTLIEHGVKTDFIKRCNCKAGHAIIQVAQNAEHTIVVHGGSNLTIEKEYVDEVIKNFVEGDIILLQNEINNIDYIIDVAFKKRMKVFLNPAPFKPSVYRYDLSKVDTLIVNEGEMLSVTRENDISKAIKAIKKHNINVVLTLGLKGGMYLSKGNKRHIYKAYALANQIDTTAVGDAFVGYFVANVANGVRIDEALDTSSKAAALTAMKMGAAQSIPLLSEIEEYDFDGAEYGVKIV